MSGVCPGGTARTATAVCATVSQGFRSAVGNDFAKLILFSTESLKQPGDDRAYLGEVLFESRLGGVF